MMAYEDTDDYKNLKRARAREDADAAEPGTETMAAFMKRTGTKARPPMARTYTKKGPIVTKEQMKKAGFDNLRDYLNAERGLKRRADKTPAAPEKTADDFKKDAADYKRVADETRRTADQMRATANTILGGNKFKTPDEIETSPESLSGPLKKGGMVKKMKSGGTVSSASKRADGCAVRGKTKGRMI